jgi:uncharacterized damage-inducible protein DinB
MPTNVSLSEIIGYTGWEREKWHEWFRKHGDDVLATTVGPHGDGRFQTVGDLVRHIFSAEKHWVDKLSNRPLTDTTSIPNSSVEALFQFGQQSRADLEEFVKTFPAQDWDVAQEFDFTKNLLRATPKKLIVNVLFHEIRHWAQVATLLRMNGLTGDFHDFLFSPVLGGEFKPVAS